MVGNNVKMRMYVATALIGLFVYVMLYCGYRLLRYTGVKYQLPSDSDVIRDLAITTGCIENETIDLERLSAMKKKLLRAKWINLFPELRRLVIDIGEVPVPKSKITNASLTTVTIHEGQEFKTGGVLEANVVAKDGEGNKKPYGGDFFLATLRPVGNENDGVACQISDRMDGSYSVKCFLPFVGESMLEILMINPSESVYEMMTKYSSVREYAVKMSTKLERNSKGVQEVTDCTIGFPRKKPDELCNFTNPTHGEQYMCLKPRSGECHKLFLQKMEPNMNKLAFWDDYYFIKDVNYKVPIKGSGATINILQSSDSPLTYASQSEQDWSLDPMAPSGWFLESKWISRKVKTFDYSVQRIVKCFEDKDLHFIGDSTIRQWYFHFRDKLKLVDRTMPIKGDGWSQPRDSFMKESNITMHFRPPGPPFHNNGDIWEFMSDVIDHVTTGGNGTILLITAGMHFQLFTPDAYLDRITRIKSAVQALLKRLPGSKVIIKGLHYHDPRPPFVISPWKTHKLELILRNVFKGMKVSFFETWDFLVVARNSLVHPLDGVLEKSMELLLSFVC